jgi:hypothetical protein
LRELADFEIRDKKLFSGADGKSWSCMELIYNNNLIQEFNKHKTLIAENADLLDPDSIAMYENMKLTKEMLD